MYSSSASFQFFRMRSDYGEPEVTFGAAWRLSRTASRAAGTDRPGRRLPSGPRRRRGGTRPSRWSCPSERRRSIDGPLRHSRRGREGMPAGNWRWSFSEVRDQSRCGAAKVLVGVGLIEEGVVGTGEIEGVALAVVGVEREGLLKIVSGFLIVFLWSPCCRRSCPCRRGRRPRDSCGERW